MQPPGTRIEGISSLAAAMSMPGTILSQLASRTIPSKAWAMAWITRHADDGGTPPRAGREPRAVALAREFLAARCAEDPDLAETARVAGLSPFHFLRVFRRTTGLTPHAFLVQCRVRRAQGLLRRGLDPARVAAETGFADQSHLTRQFKRLTGVTPAAYRNSLQDR